MQNVVDAIVSQLPKRPTIDRQHGFDKDRLIRKCENQSNRGIVDGCGVIPLLVVTPMVFLGGSFYSIDMLPEFWQTVSLFNPVLYLISGFRWSFYGIADVNVWVSLLAICGFLGACIYATYWIFKTGYKIKK